MRRLSRAFAYADWLFNPLRALDVAEIYELLGTDIPSSHGLYLNLGYWDQATTLGEASEALVALVGTEAAMGPGDRVLDCGYGFGDQDILWAQTLNPECITGLNVTASQVRRARDRVEQAGLADRIDLQLGSATDMPVESGTFDIVVALESAFHFRTRDLFFDEAWRVLKPGGRLVTADIIPAYSSAEGSVTGRRSLAWRLTASKFSIPNENAYSQAEYRQRLAAKGFVDCSIRSIRDAVYRPLHTYLRHTPLLFDALHPLARIPAWVSLQFDADRVFRGLDYVISRAVKP